MKPLVDKLSFIKVAGWKCVRSQRVRRVFDVYRGRRLKMKPRYLRLGRHYAFKLQRAA